MMKEKVNEEIVEKYNRLYHGNAKTIDEVLDILSEKFAIHYDFFGDGQMAYNELYDEYEALMDDFCFVYSLTGCTDWTLGFGTDYNSEQDQKYINIAKHAYPNDTICNINDVLSVITDDIDNTISNCGIDMLNALHLIMHEQFHDYKDLEIFAIHRDNDTPRIEVLY